jgi:hypothetical protein
MKEELEKTLTEKYPTLFKDKDDPHSLIKFGLEVGDGWYRLIDATFEALTNLYKTSCMVENEDVIKKHELKPYELDGKKVYSFLFDPPVVHLFQVKEKFGGLRIYHSLEFDPDFTGIAFGKNLEKDANYVYNRYVAYIDGIISFAETMSYKTCEYTGLPGRLHRSAGGWYKTLNDEYAINELKDCNYKPCINL